VSAHRSSFSAFTLGGPNRGKARGTVPGKSKRAVGAFYYPNNGTYKNKHEKNRAFNLGLGRGSFGGTDGGSGGRLQEKKKTSRASGAPGKRAGKRPGGTPGTQTGPGGARGFCTRDLGEPQ